MSNPAAHPTIVALQARIRALGERCQWFHLSRCACGAPCFQQPCTICGFYPMGNYASETTRVAGKGTREAFVASVGRYPNIGAWYVLESRKHTIAWANNPEFRAAVEADASACVKQPEPWPTAGEIYDIFAAK